MLANLAHLADRADGALVLCVVLGTVKRALLIACAAVDGRVAGGADLKLGKLVKLNLYRVMGVALALRLGLPGLFGVLAYRHFKMGDKLTLSRILLAPPLANILLAKLSAEL